MILVYLNGILAPHTQTTPEYHRGDYGIFLEYGRKPTLGRINRIDVVEVELRQGLEEASRWVWDREDGRDPIVTAGRNFYILERVRPQI